MFKLKRKQLTPDQMKRANITTSVTVTLTYIFFIVILIISKDITAFEKSFFGTFFIIWYIITAAFTYKNITRRRAEVFIAIGFCIGFGTICYLNQPAVMMLIFPAILSLAVYLNEYLIIEGSAATFVFVVTKIIRIKLENPVNASEQLETINIVIICLVLCAIGGCKTVKRLIEFSEEETKAVADKAQKQLEIAYNVERIVNDINNKFIQVRQDLTVISQAVDNTHNSMEVISDNSNDTASQTQLQSQKTLEIQQRIENTNNLSSEALKTTEELKSVIENGKNESDELARQSVIVDDSTEQISDTISKLAEHVDKVSGITDSILNISSQTNLLALNASIEAARAGQAGKGFAVVADEIRQLAEMTKQSTEQITLIMNELISITQLTESELKTVIDSIQVQRKNVSAVHESFISVDNNVNSLVENVTTVSDDVAAVYEANQVIVDGISTLSGISQEISANTENSKNDMDELNQRVSGFAAAIDETMRELEVLKETAAVKE